MNIKQTTIADMIKNDDSMAASMERRLHDIFKTAGDITSQRLSLDEIQQKTTWIKIQAVCVMELLEEALNHKVNYQNAKSKILHERKFIMPGIN